MSEMGDKEIQENQILGMKELKKELEDTRQRYEELQREVALHKKYQKDYETGKTQGAEIAALRAGMIDSGLSEQLVDSMIITLLGRF